MKVFISNKQKLYVSLIVISIFIFGLILLSCFLNSGEGIAYADTDIITSVTNTTYDYNGLTPENNIVVNYADGYDSSYINYFNYYDKDNVPMDYAPRRPGTYYVRIVCTDYSVFGPVQIIINKKELEVDLRDKTYTYGDPYSTDIFVVDISGFENGDSIDDLNGGAINCPYDIYGDVGEYEVTISGYSSINYSFNYLHEGKATLTVNPRPVTIKIDNKSSDYGDEIVDLTASEYSGNIVNNDEVYTLSTTATSSSPADLYDIVGTAINNNYNVTFRNLTGTNTVGNYDINQRYITVTIDSKQTAYGETPAELTYQITDGSIVGSVCPFTLSCSVTDHSNAGAYNIVGEQIDEDNYVITFINENESYTVSKRNLEITVENKTSNYGDAQVDLTSVITSGSIVYDEDIYEITCGGISQTTIPGTYPIYGQLKETTLADNYNVAFTNGTYTVTERPITLVINNKSSEYGDALVSLDATPDSSTPLVNEDSVNDIATFAIPDMVEEEVGTYTITGTDNSSKYAITFTGGTYTISKRTAYITVYPVETVYGDPIEEIITDYENILPQDDADSVYTVTCEVTTNHNVGTYHIYCSSVNSNYNVVWTSADYVITPKAATVVINNKHSTYRDDIVLFTSTSTGILDSDKPFAYKLVCDISNESNVGQYPIVGQTLTQNYNITFTNGTYTIIPKGVTVTIDNKTGGYGEAIKPLTATDDGIYEEDLSGAYTLVCDATQESNIGEYAITGIAKSENYEIIFVNGTYTITKKELTLTWSNLLFVYDGTAKKPSVTSNIDILDITVSGEQTNAGTYTATAQMQENPNYTLPDNITIEFTIKKANPSFDLSNVVKTFEYDGKYHSVYGVTGTGAISYKNNSFKDVGKYTVIVRCAESENYFPGETSVTAEITASKDQPEEKVIDNDTKSSSNNKTDTKNVVAKSDMDAGIAIWVIAGAVLVAMVVSIIVFEVIRKKNAKK